MTTYAAFVAAVAATSITGVTKKYTYKPVAVDISSGAASYVDLPSGGLNRETLTSCTSGGKQRAVDFVVVFEAVGQEQHSVNYATAITYLDRVEAALDTARRAKTYGTPILDYELSVQAVPLGDVNHWAVVASIEGQE